MKKLLFVVCTIMISVLTAKAQKALFIPAEWKVNRTDTLLYKEVDTENKYTWSKTRSKESDNFICYWDKYYTTEPTKLASSNFYYVNVDELLRKAEEFYALNVGKLAFCDEAKSKVSKYKMMILLNHTTTWTCYGAGYDFTIGALWLNPATCKPIGQSVAHEVGHSFQYMCYSDYGGHTGFHDAIGQGATIWEQTAQWQSVMSYPNLKWDQSWSIFRQSHNYAFTHEFHRYQSYWFHYYLIEKYGVDIIGKIWHHPVSKAMDFNEVFMDLMGYDVNQLYKEYFDYAMKMATIDLDVARSESDRYIGSYVYNYITLEGKKHQVAYSSCPQATGFNIIPLNVPKAGTVLSTRFESPKLTTRMPELAPGDPAVYLDKESKISPSDRTSYNVFYAPGSTSATSRKCRGFRLGYVALLNDGTRVYSSEDKVYCSDGSKTESEDIDFVVPENVKRLYFVVSPAPSVYFQHKWDENVTNDDQWPYTVEFTNTNIFGAPEISDDLPLTDATLTYDVYFARSSSTYPAIDVVVEGEAAAALGTAFQLQPSEVNNKLVTWATAGPADGKMMFYAVNPNGTISNTASSANGYGHWFSNTGSRTAYSSGYLYSEFFPATMTFTIGQYPGKLTNNSNYTIRQAIKYKKGDETATVTFVFNCHVTSTRTGYQLTDVKQADIYTSVPEVIAQPSGKSIDVYSLSGVKLKSNTTYTDALNGLPKGIYIVDGKKMRK